MSDSTKCIKHVNTPIIKTKRLVLRPFKIDDAQMMYDNWANDEEVTRFLSWLPHKNVEETKTIIQSWIDKSKNDKSYYHWAIVLKDNNEVIGSITCFENSEIGYCISRKYWNQSITTEAFKAVIYFLFKYVKMESIYAVHNINNIASGKVMKKCGLVFERQVTGSDNRNNDITCCLYKLENPDYKK